MNLAHHFNTCRNLLILVGVFSFFFFFDMHTAAAAATLSQEQYIFINDNGSTTDKYTQSHSDATNTPITNVKKGEKLISRIQIANTGTTAATTTYRLQWENNTDAPNTWTDLGTTTQIQWALSQQGALRASYGEVPLVSNQVGTCTTTTTYVAGLFVGGTATSSAYSLNPNKCTELAFAIETSGATLGKTYRLRLVSGSTTSALNAYPQYPTFTMESAQSIRYSKETRGGFSTTTLKAAGTVGYYTSMAIGIDGFPVISYFDTFKLGIIKCSNPSCSMYTSSTTDTGGDLGRDTYIAIGSDGFPLVTYYDATKFKLILGKCSDIYCTGFATSTIDAGLGDASNMSVSSIAIGSDGFPVIAYYNATSSVLDLKLAKCNNVSCSSVATSTLDSAGDVGSFNSITIGIDGFPVIAYPDTTLNKLKVMKCSDMACVSTVSSTLDTGTLIGQYPSMQIGTDGYPVMSYYNGNSGYLKFAKCGDISCTAAAAATSTLHSENPAIVGSYNSLAIGIDGFPVISYYDGTRKYLDVAKCNNISCSSYSTSSLDQLGVAGSYTSIAIGTDGYPVISYMGNVNDDLFFAKCNDIYCRTAASSTANLATNNADLGNYLDDDAYTNVASSDNIYDSIAAGTSTRLAYVFSRKNRNNTDMITATWEGQVSKATTTYLKIYNSSSTAWEVLTSNAAPAANTDFTLTYTASTSVGNYYDANNVVYIRVETGTTTGTTTLKTDYASVGLPTISQTAYIFLNDDGTSTDQYTKAHSAATSTPITSVKKGEKLIARMQIDNTGLSTSTVQYRLQWENNTDAANTWTDLGTSTQIRWGLSQKGALPAYYGEVPLATNQVDTCTTTTTFSSGLFVGGTATSSILGLGPNKCTELAYTIETSGATLSKTYRLRLVTGSTTIALDAYTKYPTFTIESAQSIRYSKEVHGGYSTTTLDNVGSLGDAISMAIGVDGFPVIAYHDITHTNLNFAKCRDASCASYSTSTLDSGGVDDDAPSIAIGSDGLPVIRYYNGANNINFAKCNNVYCTSVSTSTITAGGAAGSNMGGIVIGTDGFPVIAYYANAEGVRVIKCNNLTCSSRTDSDVDPGTGSMGWYLSMAIGSDGFPVISYSDGNAAKLNLNFAKCNNLSCSSAATSTLDSAGDRGEWTSIAIGSDGFPVIVYDDETHGYIDLVKCKNVFCSGNDTNPTGYSTSTLLATDRDYSASLVIGTDGYPVIAYRNNNPGSLKFLKCNNVACSSSTVSSLDTSGNTGQYVSMAIGTDGYPAIAYQDITKSDIIFAKCNNTDCAPATSATGTLTSTNADLGSYFDDAAYTNVAASDNVYDSISAGTSTRLAYLFTKKAADNTHAIGVTWEGQISKATTTYLKIYNNSTGAWEVLTSNAAPTANTDFTLAGTQSSNLSSYYDGSNVAYIRVETGTTTASTTLMTDYVNMGSPLLAQTAYIFLNDNGTTTDKYTQSHNAATSTAITNVKKGEKLVTRIQIDNTGTGTSTAQYRLQWENNTDAAGTWTDLSTTTQIQWTLSQTAGRRSPYGQVPLPTNQVGTCTTTTTYSAGLFTAGGATTTAYSLDPNKCTELAFAIETSGATLNKTYRLRLVTGSTTSALDAYTQYPTFTMESTQNIRYSKEARGGYSTTTLDKGLVSGTRAVGEHSSVAIGSDGFPVIAYWDINALKLLFAKCNDPVCGSYATSTLDTNAGNANGDGRISVNIGRDGNPVIGYYQSVAGQFKIAKCNNLACSSPTLIVAATGQNDGFWLSMAIGADGFPIAIQRQQAISDPVFTHCEDASCSTVTTTRINGGDASFDTLSMSIGSDGFPVALFTDSGTNLHMAKCNNFSCSSMSTSTVVTSGGGNGINRDSITIGDDGFPILTAGDDFASQLLAVHCRNLACTSTTTSVIDIGIGSGSGSYTSKVTIGADGFPMISYEDHALGFDRYKYAKCGDIACTASLISTTTLDSKGNSSFHAPRSSIALGTNGFPVISYFGSTTNSLMFVSCNNENCSPNASSSANLTSTNNDLGTYLDDAGYTNVASSDNIYDSISAGTSTRLAYLFTEKNRNNTDMINVTWEGQISKATTTYLKIYNNSTGAWEVLNSNTAPAANTDFTLTGTQASNVANYYDGSNVAYIRVETGTTTASTTLKTDYVNLGVGVPTLAQTAYIFLNDNGTTTDKYTQSHSAATSTPITNVKKGEKLVARIQIDNTGTGTFTNQYRLQWENNTDAAGTWTDLSTTTQIRWELSQNAGRRSPYGQVPLPTNQVGTCTTTTTYSAGLFTAGGATTTSYALSPSKCTELAFAIETSGATLNKTYRLRLVTGSTTNALDAYTQYPTFTMESTQNIRYSKEARGGYSTTTLDKGFVSGTPRAVGEDSSMAIGSDGFPVIAYWDINATKLLFAKCNDPVCGSYATSTIDTNVSVVGQNEDDISLTIGRDGNPVIGYYNFSIGQWKIAKCNNLVCTSPTLIVAVTGNNEGGGVSMAIGSDGYPIALYAQGATNAPFFAHCEDASCGTVTTTRIDGSVDTGTISMTIGSDGYPVGVYGQACCVSQTNLYMAKCNNQSCSSMSTSTVIEGEGGSGVNRFGMTIGSDGFPIIAVRDSLNQKLMAVHCRNFGCTSTTTANIDMGQWVGYGLSVTIGTDGFPMISYDDSSPGYDQHKYAKCGDVACTATLVSTTTLDIKGGQVDGKAISSIALGTNGFPFISYFGSTTNSLMFVSCNNEYCSPNASSSANLASTKNDLGSYLDDAGYTNVANSDNIYDSISAGTSTRLAYLFTKKNGNNTDPITPTWEGQVSRATTTYLKIYNNTTSAWEVLASNAAPAANTDFTLTGTQSTGLSNYYDGSNVAYIRVETGTTTGTTSLKTDYVSMGLPSIAQTAYIFLNDNGTTTDKYTQAHSAATSTAITNVKKGEKLVARIQIDNTGTATSTAQYRLQWENNTDAAGTWTDLSTTTQIQWTLSQNAALPSRYGEVPLTTLQVGTCTTTTTFSSGLFVAGTATSSQLSLGPTKCTELAYAIETSGATLNKTYRLRLVTGSTTNVLTAYTQYPTFTIESAQSIRYSKEARGGIATTTLDSGISSGNDYTAFAIGVDGLPVIAYRAETPESLKFAKCNDLSCSSRVISTLDGGNGGVTSPGRWPSMAIGTDGFPIITYYDLSPTSVNKGSFELLKCNNITCTSFATSTIDVGLGYTPTVNLSGSSIAIGSDGYPVISYRNATTTPTGQDLMLAKCNNTACTSVSTSTLDSQGNVGTMSSITIGPDSFPIIAYRDGTNSNLNFLKCNNVSCSSVATSSIDVGGDGYGPTIAIGSDGYPVIANHDTSPAVLRFTKCNDNSCTSRTSSTLDVGVSTVYPSLAIGTDGFPVMAYPSPTSDIDFVKCNNIGCTSYATATIETFGSVSTLNLAIGTDGYPIISLMDTTNGALRVLKCGSISCFTGTSTTLANLPNTNADLANYLDDTGYQNVANSDNVYDSIYAATGTRAAYLFTKKNGNNTDPITPLWEGQVSRATTTYLKIYNNSTAAWEVLASNAAPAANTDFTLTGTQSTGLSSYYDGSNVTYIRVETGTTTASTTLMTDQVSIGIPTVAQTAYIFLNDDGTSTDTYTRAHSAATSTAITNVKKGEKLVARIQIDNTGLATSTNQYRLQWENNTDAAGTWTDLSTTTQIRWGLSQKGALPSRYGEVPLTTNQVGTCTTTTTFSSGLFVGGTATSSMLGLGPNKCTELAYTIETSGATLNKTYRLRLVTGSTTNVFTAYTQYPTFTMEFAQNIRYSKEARGPVASSTPLSGTYSAIAIGIDGFPAIAYRDYNSGGDMKFAKCNDAACSSSSSTIFEFGDGGNGTGKWPSIAIGSDGFPVISYYDAIKFKLNIAKCNDVACASFATSTLDAGVGDGPTSNNPSSVAIGSDGFPVIAYYNATSSKLDLKFAKCNNIACTSVATSTLDSGGDVGSRVSLAIGSDGFPVISYYDNTKGRLDFAKCADVSCSSVATSTLDNNTGSALYAPIAIGQDGFPVIAYNNTTSGSLYFAKCNNISCTSAATSTLDSTPGDFMDAALTIGTDGFPVIVYRDGTSGTSSVDKCQDAACLSHIVTTVAVGQDGGTPSITIGSDGNPLITGWNGVTFNLMLIRCSNSSCFGKASSTSYLSTTNANLGNYLDDAGYTNVANSDNIYDSVFAATGTRAAYLFTKKNGNNTDPITPLWEGQVSRATTTYLKIYNNSSGAWEILSSTSTPVANTDFTLTGTQSTSLSNYYDGSNVTYIRVETGTTTASTTLKTDQVSIGIPTVAQTAYIFLNDDGTTTDKYTQAHSAATNTPITSVKKGEKLVARMQIDNTGTATSTNQYRLQWENNTDALGVWNDLSTTTQVHWGLSQKGALPSRYGEVPLTTNQVGTCTTTTTFSSGLFVGGTATSSMLGLGPNKCTELAYAIETASSTLGKTYRLRLVTGSTTALLDAYTQYPTFTIEPGQTIRYSKEARGGIATSTLDSGIGILNDNPAVVIGVDGFPVIAYRAQTPRAIKFAKCNDLSCSSVGTTSPGTRTLDGGNGGNTMPGAYPSMAIGTDGFPVIVYYDLGQNPGYGSFELLKCNDIACASYATSSIDVGIGFAPTVSLTNSSIAIGSDGYPVITYYNGTTTPSVRQDLMFAKCNNVACSSVSTSTLDSGGDVGDYNSITIGADGFPVIAYYDGTNGNLNFAKCSNVACTSYATSSLDTASNFGWHTSIAIGSDGFPVISYFDQGPNDLRFTKCNDISCTSRTSSTLDSGGTVGQYGALAIGTDGFPLIVVQKMSGAVGNVMLLKCNNVACSSYATSTIDSFGDIGQGNALAIGSDGYPIIATGDNAGAIRLIKCGSTSCFTATSTTLANLPTTNANLANYLDDAGYTNVAFSDNIYDSITAATGTRAAYLFARKNGNNTDAITATWEGQISKATTTYLKIYNVNSGAWEVLTSNAAPAANVDFTLTGTQSSNLSNYYDASNFVYMRVETGTTTASTTLKTDQISLSVNIVQNHYRWRADNGSETGAAYIAPEDIPLAATSSMYKGDRMRLRMLLNNTGGSTATNFTYRLEVASSSCANTYYTVPTSATLANEEWVMDLSQYILDGAPTTNSSSLTDPAGQTFIPGEIRVQSNTTGLTSLSSAQFSEYEYSIRSTSRATANLLYCFRVSNAGVTTNFTYTAQPQVTLNGNTRVQVGGSGLESVGNAAPVGGGGQGGGQGLEPPPPPPPPVGGGGSGGGGSLE